MSSSATEVVAKALPDGGIDDFDRAAAKHISVAMAGTRCTAVTLPERRAGGVATGGAWVLDDQPAADT